MTQAEVVVVYTDKIATIKRYLVCIRGNASEEWAMYWMSDTPYDIDSINTYLSNTTCLPEGSEDVSEIEIDEVPTEVQAAIRDRINVHHRGK